jgi:hypothetical protein
MLRVWSNPIGPITTMTTEVVEFEATRRGCALLPQAKRDAMNAHLLSGGWHHAPPLVRCDLESRAVGAELRCWRTISGVTPTRGF